MYQIITKKIAVLTHRHHKRRSTDRHSQRTCLFLSPNIRWQSTHLQRSLRVFFKLIGQSKAATLASGEITEARHGSAEPFFPSLSPSKLLYIADKHNKCNYLIDTGAAVSVLPKSCANRTSYAACLPLIAANNTAINTYGDCRRVVDAGLKRDYVWTFIVADVKQPIIGADFLIHYSLLVDFKSRCLGDMRTGLAIPATLSSIKPLSLNRVDKIVTKGHPVFPCQDV